MHAAAEVGVDELDHIIALDDFPGVGAARAAARIIITGIIITGAVIAGSDAAAVVAAGGAGRDSQAVIRAEAVGGAAGEI